MDLRMTKDDLLTALEARRPFFVARDKAMYSQHREAEREWERKIKARAREITKMSYAELKESFEKHNRWMDSPPSCPISDVVRLDRALSAIKVTSNRNFTITSKGGNADLYYLLTTDDTPSSVC